MDYRKDEAGFTLVELFVVIAIIGVLAAISIQTFKEYRQISYDSHADLGIVNAKTALQAGLGDLNEEDTRAMYSAWSNAGGLSGVPNTDFVSGLRVDDEVRININYDGFCDSADTAGWCPAGTACCVSEWYQAYHCKGKFAKIFTRWNNGQTDELEIVNPGC